MMDLEDPLEGYEGLSLFPRTFASLSIHLQPHDSDDPHFIHNFLKSLPVRDPDKLMEQAKNILDNTTQIPEIKLTNDAASEENNVVVADMAAKYPRGQRPGLQRKRPRFSLIPNIRQPTVNLEPTLDFDKYKDPEEFFTAYERLENAKKEIAKQTGCGFTNSDQYNVFMVPRSQRPGIPGRSKTAKYRHLYPAMPSQETCEEDIVSNCGSQGEKMQPGVASQQTEPASVASQQLQSTNDASEETEGATAPVEEMEQTGSVAKAENRVNQLLDELLAHGYGELEGDKAVNLLQERLQIKPLHIEKLNLPEMKEIQQVNFKVSEINLPKSRNILSEINNLLNKPRNTTPMETKDIENSLSNFGSPTPPKSPLASLSLLKKRMFQSNTSRDPFSFIDINLSLARNASPVKSIIEHSDPIDSDKTLCISGKLKPLRTEDVDVPVNSRISNKLAIEDFTSSIEEHVNENLTGLSSGSEAGPRESRSRLEQNKVDVANEFINKNLSQAGADLDLHKNGPEDMEDMVEGMLQDAEASTQADQHTDDLPVETSKSIQNGHDQSNTAPADKHALIEYPETQDGSPKRIKETAPENHIELQETSTVSKKSERKLPSRKGQRKLRSHSGQDNKTLPGRQGLADLAVVEVQTVGGSAEHMDCVSVQTKDTLEQTQVTALKPPNEKIQKSSVISTNEQTKGKSRPGKESKGKNLSGRQSLAGCGMSWETGVRRSTRIRSRPLEYWKGERFLYGRIHQSLATIIGIKYESPGKDTRRPTMKVKSFVSDEYKDLVEQAALY